MMMMMMMMMIMMMMVIITGSDQGDQCGTECDGGRGGTGTGAGAAGRRRVPRHHRGAKEEEVPQANHSDHTSPSVIGPRTPSYRNLSAGEFRFYQ